MKVVFNRIEEFLKELRANRDDVEDGIVRICHLIEIGNPDLPICCVSIVAGVIVRGRLIELKSYCGDIFDGDKLPEKSVAAIDHIKTETDHLELEWRAGRFQE